MALIDRVAHRLKLRDLRLLDAVVRSKSMARAAVQLNVTQRVSSRRRSAVPSSKAALPSSTTSGKA
jgi:hypothetical protein